MYQLNILWSARLSMALSAPHVLFFFLLAHTIPQRNLTLNKTTFFALSVITVLVMALNFSPYVFADVVFVGGRHQVINGSLLWLSETFLVALSAATFYFLLRNIRRTQGVERKQILLMFFGIILMIGLLIGTVVLPVLLFKNDKFLNYAPLYTLIFNVFTAVAVLKYRLFDLRFLITEGLLAVLNIFLFLQVAFSPSVNRFIVNILIFLAAIYISWRLIRSHKKEVALQTELARTDALKESNLKLQQLDRQKTEFLTIAAHHLRTPVSIMNNYLAMIKDGDYGAVSAALSPVLENMDTSNQWLVRLADEFVAIANLEQGATKFHIGQENLSALVALVVKEFAGRAKAQGLSIKLEKPPEPITAPIDAEKIRQALMNLLDNAIKYSEHGAITVSVKMQEDNDENQEPNKEKENKVSGVVVSVRDQGIGFEAEDLPNFFQKFQRGNNAKTMHVNTSTGLGLYIARMFVEGHSGRVWAKSEGLGKGSEFGFWIPFDRSNK